MSFSHLVILGIILIIVIPPEKLPEVMRNIGRVFNDLRRSTAGVFDELKKEAEIRPSDLMKYKPQQPPTPGQSTAPTAEKSDESKS